MVRREVGGMVLEEVGMVREVGGTDLLVLVGGTGPGGGVGKARLAGVGKGDGADGTDRLAVGTAPPLAMGRQDVGMMVLVTVGGLGCTTVRVVETGGLEAARPLVGGDRREEDQAGVRMKAAVVSLAGTRVRVSPAGTPVRVRILRSTAAQAALLTDTVSRFPGGRSHMTRNVELCLIGCLQRIFQMPLWKL